MNILKIIIIRSLLLLTITTMNNASEIVYIFAHGIADTHTQVYKFTKKKLDGSYSNRYIIDEPFVTFDFPDATIKFWQTSLGQSNEILTLHKEYTKILTQSDACKNKNCGIVAMGVSRGASTILNFAGVFKPSKIKALVLESPFDDVHNLVTNILKKMNLHKIPGSIKLGHTILGYVFRKHRKNSLCPLLTAPLIDINLPILMVCSEEDKIVPYENTINLYKALLKSGHKNAYLLILKKGYHSKLFEGEDGNIYLYAVHAFYKKHNLPHEPEFAHNGISILLSCQPALDDLP